MLGLRARVRGTTVCSRSSGTTTNMSDQSGNDSDPDNNIERLSNKKSVLTKHCGLRTRLHQAKAVERAVRADLADKDLLEAAEGGLPSSVRMIKDVPIHRIPGVPGESQHDAAVFKATIQNEKNHEKRLRPSHTATED